MYHAYKLNGKLTKECTGLSGRGNHWYISDNFTKWFDKGALAWCEIKEVKTPYEVEKVVKKTIKAESSKTDTEQNITVGNYTYEITEDIDTRTEDKIYLVKVKENLNREEYIKVNQYIKSIGGYYSKFKHAFLFKENPCEKLNTEIAEPMKEKSQEKSIIKYTVIEDVHTKTGEKLFIVKPDTELPREDFVEVKRKFATMQGYYSSFKGGFIFKYDPTEKLNQ